MTPAYRYAATVLKIVDGDTVDLRVDCGFRLFVEDRFRFYGINAPELANAPAGPDAKAALAAMIPVGSAIVVETMKPKDKYGRWLGILHTAGEAASVNDRMVASGNAVPYFP